jgi:hypothetical protein
MKKHFFKTQQLQRTLLYAISIVFILSSCKKNKGDVKVPVEKTKLISAVYINDTIVEKYFYNNNRQLNKIDRFTSKGILDAIWNYEYDAVGDLKYLNSFQPDGVARTTHEYFRDVNRQVIQSKFKNFKNNYHSHVEYMYEPAGNKQMLGYIESDTLGNKNSKVDYLYKDGMLSGINYSFFLPVGIEMYSSSVIELTKDVTLLKRYKEATSSLPEPRPDNWLIDQIAESYKLYYYTSGEMTYEHLVQITEKKFDAKGYVTGLKITIKKVKPAGPDIVKTLRYEYVEL